MTVQEQRRSFRAQALKAAKPLLEVDHLKKYFAIKSGVLQRRVGAIKAVDDVSFSIYPGETLGLVGESGCGKSTLGRTIIRLYEPTQGRIIFDGEDVSLRSERRLTHFRRNMQMVFQDPYSSLNPRKTVGTVLAEPFSVHGLYRGERQDRVDALMETVGLNPILKNRYPHEFSGGQRQRISIARALALRPRLIIADEPVSALDVSIQSQVLNLMTDLQTEFALTYLFIAHDLAVVRHISDRIGVMYLGNLVELTSKDTLYRDPLHPYTEALLSAVPKAHPNELRPGRVLLQGDLPNPENPPTGCVFSTRCPKVMDHCHQTKPTLIEHKPDHWIACHLYD